MRLFCLFILFAFFFSFHVVFADCAITSVLRVGSKGAEVQCLQGKLGVVTDGSFGPLTKGAVIAFQSSNGLVTDGIVGHLTLLALNRVNIATNEGNYPTGCAGITGYSILTGIKCDSVLNNPVPNNANSTPSIVNNNNQTPQSGVSTNNTPTNPNLVNLDQFINTVVEIGKRNGKNDQELKLIADNLKKVIASSDMDYNKAFKELLINESKLSVNSNNKSLLSAFDKVVGKALSFLGITPSIAQASAGIPFGGALIFPFFCPYNANWMIEIEPLPPSYAVLLSYYPGTQGFASYNIPFTTWLLGTYSPPGVCMIPGTPVYVIPTQGTITPVVGSSPL
ncbi:MAG: peptidoglycan-binding domain-containing protein [Candidatus Nomurabacteria bacterium]|nr:peptidoglycan-binding domain-containing protein [Candidatus Nomurabacteria bacterium]